MGLLDDLKKLLGEKGDKASEAADKASEAAGKAAARQAWRATTAAVNEVGDDFVGAAEKELKAAEEARKGRADFRPRQSEEADDIAAGIEAAARRADERRRALARGEAPADAEPQEGLIGLADEDDPKGRARRELERLKAQLKAGKDDPPPPKEGPGG